MIDWKLIIDGNNLYFSFNKYRFVSTFLLSNIDSSLLFFFQISIRLHFSFIEYRFVSTFLLSNIDSSLLSCIEYRFVSTFHYRFSTLLLIHL